MVIMSGSVNVTSLSKSPEIAGPVSSGLCRSMPPVSDYGVLESRRLRSSLIRSLREVYDVFQQRQKQLSLITRLRELFTDSVVPPPPKRLLHVTLQKHLPPSFARPTGQLAYVDLAPLTPFSPASQKTSRLKPPSIPDIRIRWEPENSGHGIPHQFET
jgi:hypothetical protein